MTKLYQSVFAEEQRKVYNKWKLVCIVSAVTAFALCVVLCFFVTTATARPLFYAVTAVSVLTGWVYILVFRPFRRNALFQYKHCEGILKKDLEEAEVFTGTVRVLPYQILIPGSISVKTVKLNDGVKEHTLHLNARFSLPEGSQTLTLRCVNNYITAYEVPQDA